MPTSMTAILLALTTLLSSVSFTPGTACADDNFTIMQELRTAWMVRRQRYRSLRLACTVTGTATNLGWRGDGRQLSYEFAMGAVVSGEKLRVDFDGNYVEPSLDGEFKLETFKQSLGFNGKEARIFSPAGNGHHRPCGSISWRADCDHVRSLTSFPVCWFSAPLDDRIRTVDLDGCMIADRKVVNGDTCVLLLQNPDVLLRSTESFDRYWICPSKDWSVVQYHNVQDGVLRSAVQVDYERHDNDMWVPTKWTVKRFNVSGQPTQVRSVVVDSREVNGALQPDEFDVPFPPGTVVTDGRKEAKKIRERREKLRKKAEERMRRQEGLPREQLPRA